MTNFSEELRKIIDNNLESKKIASVLNDQNFIYENTDDNGEWIAECLETNLLNAVRERLISAITELVKGIVLNKDEIEGIIIDEYNDWLSTTKEITNCFKESAIIIHTEMLKQLESL